MEINRIDEFDDNVIYCANCENCILFKETTEDSQNHYYLRVKCGAGNWNKKKGGEKYYKYFTVARRKTDFCKDYLPMGDAKSFLKDLKSNLPLSDEIYTYTQKELALLSK